MNGLYLSFKFFILLFSSVSGASLALLFATSVSSALSSVVSFSFTSSLPTTILFDILGMLISSPNSFLRNDSTNNHD